MLTHPLRLTEEEIFNANGGSWDVSIPEGRDDA